GVEHAAIPSWNLPVRYRIKLISCVYYIRTFRYPTEIDIRMYCVDQNQVPFSSGRFFLAEELHPSWKFHFWYQRIEVTGLHSGRPEFADDRQRGRFPQVLNTGFVTDPGDDHSRPSWFDTGFGQLFEHAVRYLTRSAVDRFHRLLDERGRDRFSAQLPQQVVRIAGNAMSPHSRPWKAAQGAVRLGASSNGHFDRVQIERAARVRDLIGQRQVHCSKNVLVQLGQLSCFRRTDQVHRIGDPVDDLRRLLRARSGDTADHPGGFPLRVVVVARVDAFRAEGDENIAPHSQSALLQRLHQHFSGRAHVRRGSQDDRLTGLSVLHHGSTRRTKCPGVRYPIFVHWGGNRNDHHISIRELSWITSQLQHSRAQHGIEPSALLRRQIDFAGLNGAQPLFADVETDHSGVRGAQRVRGGQTDVAQPDHHCGQL